MSTVKAITSSVTTSVFPPVEALRGKWFFGIILEFLWNIFWDWYQHFFKSAEILA